ncbi:hypothetical protein [Actinoplanes sp. OR16]|nr:hypothetical protein [Actinoplanes sp. OR16]
MTLDIEGSETAQDPRWRCGGVTAAAMRRRWRDGGDGGDGGVTAVTVA